MATHAEAQERRARKRASASHDLYVAAQELSQALIDVRVAQSPYNHNDRLAECLYDFALEALRYGRLVR